MLLSVCEKGTCKSEELSNNLLKNVFFITGSINTIAELSVDTKKIKKTNLEGCAYNYNSIGYEVGRVFR
jgi:hypothetical protein